MGPDARGPSHQAGWLTSLKHRLVAEAQGTGARSTPTSGARCGRGAALCLDPLRALWGPPAQGGGGRPRLPLDPLRASRGWCSRFWTPRGQSRLAQSRFSQSRFFQSRFFNRDFLPNRDFPFENRDWLFLVAIGLFSFVWTILVQIALVVEVGLLPFSPAVPKACRRIRWVGV